MNMRRAMSFLMAAALCVSMSMGAAAATGYATGTSGDGTSYTPPESTVSGNTVSKKEVTEKETVKAATKAVSEAAKNDSDTATVKLQNATTVTKKAIQEVAKAAEKAEVKAVIHADKMVGNRVESRIYIDASVADKLPEKVNLTVSVDPKDTKPVAEKFAKAFSNNIAVVSLGQKGSYGAEIGMAVKVDLGQMDLTNLVFQVYDRTTNKFTTLTNAQYYVDKNGYLHFMTTLGGDVVISEGNLTPKK